MKFSLQTADAGVVTSLGTRAKVEVLAPKTPNIPDSDLCLFFQVNSEEKIFFALRNWIAFDAEERTAHALELLQCLRFSSLDHQFISSVIAADELIQKSPECAAFFQGVLCAHTSLVKVRELCVLFGQTFTDRQTDGQTHRCICLCAHTNNFTISPPFSMCDFLHIFV